MPRLLLSVFMGVSGLILVMKAWVWFRYGKEAAKAVSLEP